MSLELSLQERAKLYCTILGINSSANCCCDLLRSEGGTKVKRTNPLLMESEEPKPGEVTESRDSTSGMVSVSFTIFST